MLTELSPPSTGSRSAFASKPDKRPHAVVIGSGFGGLAAAIRLGARGYRVSVLERLDQPGGRARIFRQDGFTFDAGPTIVTAPFLFEELWSLCGRRMQDDVALTALDPFYRLIFDDGATLDCSGDDAAMRARIAAFAPDDIDGYEAFLKDAEAIYKIGFEQLADVPFSTLADMLKALPGMARLRADRSVYGLAARHVKNERLRTALSFHPLFIGGNPFAVTAIYALVIHLEKKYGVHFAHGGTGALVQGLARLIEGQGGTIRLNAEVAEITISGDAASGVRLASGEEIAADIVVSNADAAYTYGALLPGRRRKRWSDRKLARARYSMSVVVWYFGTNRRYEDVPHHTILFGPRYRGLIDDIFEAKTLSDDFSLYLHRPTATDPALAPPGCDAFYALVPVPNLQGSTDWAAQAEPFRQRIQDRLEATLLPGLGEAIATSRLMTPPDFRDDYLSVHGAAFGLEPRLLQSAWFRPHNLSEEVSRLYLVGAGTHPGAGLPGVLSSAKILDTVVPHATDLARA
jgi:phytoene desaturase